MVLKLAVFTSSQRGSHLNLREVLSWCNTPWLSKILGKLILLFYGPVWQGVEALPLTIPVMITRIANFVSRIFLKRKETTVLIFESFTKVKLNFISEN